MLSLLDLRKSIKTLISARVPVNVAELTNPEAPLDQLLPAWLLGQYN